LFAKTNAKMEHQARVSESMLQHGKTSQALSSVLPSESSMLIITRDPSTLIESSTLESTLLNKASTRTNPTVIVTIISIASARIFERQYQIEQIAEFANNNIRQLAINFKVKNVNTSLPTDHIAAAVVYE
jgi:hypothetical protein